MMKKLVSALALLLVAAMAFAAQFGTIHFEIPRSEQEFTVDYKVLKGMKSMKFPNQEDLYVTRAYKVKSRGTEGVMTYSLFKDTGVSDDMRDIEVMLWTRLCTLNATGLDPDKIPQLSRFKDEDVRGEFNGDCGTTNFVRGEFKNEFLRGYSYASIESFYKKGQGLVVRVAMSNDMAFFGIQPDGSFSPENTFSDFYDSFRFKDPEPHYAPAGSKDAVSLASVKVDGMKPAKAPKTKVLPVSRAFDLEKDGIKGKVTLSLFKDTDTQPGTYKEEVLGQAEVRQTIRVPGVGVIAGSYIIDGKVTRASMIRVLRDNVVIFEDKISSLKRFKDDVKEVAQGYECGIGLEKFNDIHVGDVLEAYVMEEVKA